MAKALWGYICMGSLAKCAIKIYVLTLASMPVSSQRPQEQHGHYGSNLLGTGAPSEAQLHLCTLMLGRLTTRGLVLPPSFTLTIKGNEVVSEAMHCRGPRCGHWRLRRSGGCRQLPTHS